MGVARDGGNTRELKVKLGDLVPVAGLLGESNNEGAETAVNVETDLVTLGERRELRNGVDRTVGEVGRRSDNHDSVRVDEALHALDISLARRRVDRHDMQLNLEVLRCLPECSVCGLGDDPASQF